MVRRVVRKYLERWQILFLIALLGVMVTALPLVAQADSSSYGGISSIAQGRMNGGRKEIIEENITKYYPETGPLVVRIRSIFTFIAADNAELVVTNAKNETVFYARGNKYFLAGEHWLTGFEKKPAGKYRVQLIWGSMNLGEGGYKDFEVVKGQHPGVKTSVTGVSLNQNTLSMKQGSTKVLTAKVMPANATNKAVHWSSSNPKVATVTNGKVTAVKAGSATIKVTTVDGAKTASCKVMVAGKTGNADNTGNSGSGSQSGSTMVSSKYTVGALSYTIKNGKATVKGAKKKAAAKITIPSTVKIKGTKIPVTAIASNAFKAMKNLKSVVIGKNVRTIGKNAFYGCKNLKKITIKTTRLTIKSVASNAFKGIYKRAVISNPGTKKAFYKKLLLKKGMKKTMKFR